MKKIKVLFQEDGMVRFILMAQDPNNELIFEDKEPIYESSSNAYEE
jgi:hypothetical protein